MNRNWVFRKALPEPISSPTPHPPPDRQVPRPASSSTIASSGSTHTRTLRQTPVTLFRFSALTFNPHKIHYSLPWARDVEGHRDLVVHGPLNLISILDLWRDVKGQNATTSSGSEALDSGLFLPESISYRATSPLYAGDEYRAVLEEEDEGDGARVQIFDTEGVVAMKADIRGGGG
jgi:hydroxyacyl-ACP dehydratase HTD2-like protein with hotdog domain